VFLLYKYLPCATGRECQKTRVWLVDFERIVAVCDIPLIPKKRTKGEQKGTPVSSITNPAENRVQNRLDETAVRNIVGAYCTIDS
jgi:hypothetical protein